nr:hypothetical protein GCM10020092_085140 [Actinoplanes digitatis]
MPSAGDSTTALTSRPDACRRVSWARSSSPSGGHRVALLRACDLDHQRARLHGGGVGRCAEAEAADRAAGVEVGAEGRRGRVEEADPGAGQRQVRHERGALEHHQRREQHLQPAGTGDGQQVRRRLVHPFERLGDAEIALPLPDGGNISCGRCCRAAQTGTGVERPTPAIVDEEHEPADILRDGGVAGHGIVETFEPGEDVGIF